MQYLITFLEGIITFISPCLLPLLPVYITYFAGGLSDGSLPEDNTQQAGIGRTLIRTCGFIIGFTIVFIVLGAAFGTMGRILTRYQTWVNLVAGLIIIFFGITYTGIIKWNPFMKMSAPGSHKRMQGEGFFSAVLFGLVFSICWTPCVGTFLGSALMMASGQGSTLVGILLLLCYSAGLGIPFLIASVLIDRLAGAITWIKKHYRIINIICGIFLICIGILIATGLMGKWIGLLA